MVRDRRIGLTEREEWTVEGMAFVLAQNEVAVNLTLPGIIALIAGVLILIYPRILNYVVAFYLILVGAIEVFDLKI